MKSTTFRVVCHGTNSAGRRTVTLRGSDGAETTVTRAYFARLVREGRIDRSPEAPPAKERLDSQTLYALEHKAAVASDMADSPDVANDPDDPDGWKRCAAALRFVLRAQTVSALRGSRAAMRELEDYLGGDMPAAERRAIQADLCRAGWYERHDPDAVRLGRRAKTLIVDGTRYEVA